MRFPWRSVVIALSLCTALCSGDSPAPPAAPAASSSLRFNARSRHEMAPKSGKFEIVERAVQWDPKQTALIICDLWDKHWCAGATQRCGEMAPRINALAEAVRAHGGLIVHAPSDTMKFYEGTPQRKLAQDASAVTSVGIIRWNKIDPAVEAPLPIDDTDGGCDDEPQCKNYRAWSREHPAVIVAAQDAVSDSGQEIYNLFQQRGIRNVLYCGVHTNMCVLGRSFGIRQMHKLGLNTLLVRDLTDTMYNHRMSPFVPHARGTDLVVSHVEKYWCPTVLSSDVLGDPRPPRVAIVIAEDEYHASETLLRFATAELQEKLGLRCTIVQSDSKTDVPGLEAIDDADLLVMFMRRRTLPDAQLDHFKRYTASGKPLVAIRTSSHAFQNWPEFDRVVLGCHYENHYANHEPMHIAPAPETANEPLLRGLSGEFASASSLYRIAPLEKTALPLLMGTCADKRAEPVAIANIQNGGRVFYTTLGAPPDFENPQFRRLLTNGILWALDRPIADPSPKP